MGIFKKEKKKATKAKGNVTPIKKTTKKATKTVSPKPNLSPILAAQKALGVPETGIMDYTTMNKIQKFQILNDLPATGEADDATLKRLV
mgnify:CR=1 FL=1